MVRKESQVRKARTGSPRGNRRRPGQRGEGEWQLQDAKARFSEVFRLARDSGPQRVTRHGREAVVVVCAEEFARLSGADARKGSLAEFFAASPLRGSGIELERPRDFGRDLSL